MHKSTKVITIGEFDPTGGVGIIRDSDVLREFDMDPVMLAASLKLPDGTAPVQAETLDLQMRGLINLAETKDIKIGQLAKRPNIETVCSFFEDRDMRAVRLTLDVCVDAGADKPVLASGALSLMRMRLLPLATIAIAYLSEAGRLASIEVDTISQMKEAAEAIHLFGPRNVLIRADRLVDDDWVDIFFDGREHQFLFIKSVRPSDIREGRDDFASALAAHLARGRDVLESVGAAQQFESRGRAAQERTARGTRALMTEH